MLDKKEFEDIRKEMESFEEKREEVIRTARDIIHLSKQMIYSVQRHEVKEAEKLVEEIKTKVESLPEKHYDTDIQYVAVQEYVEAMAFLNFVKHKKIPTRKELNVDIENYLLGLCDLTGELVRQAVNYIINKKDAEALEIKKVVEEIYGEFLKFNLRGGNLRKKADAIKWNLNKLEDLALSITLKD
ncbi:MAG: hypothetical protein KKA65_00335 [Nanoarchaeota archaeon]|nr:hypothetical protein [Nanoarchaeota archaeon]MBU4352422.1 hypothetical protein [Nanoarchaeota archaeon]MBU4455932.1 hypothetical protein [Nanoarchaeota archaeon]MCG2720363.1 hypothetical protein [Nanoarchaeota archaeon]